MGGKAQETKLIIPAEYLKQERIPISYIKTLVEWLIKNSNTNPEAQKLAAEILKLYLYPNAGVPDDLFKDALDQYFKTRHPGSKGVGTSVKQGFVNIVSKIPNRHSAQGTPNQGSAEESSTPSPAAGETQNKEGASPNFDTTRLEEEINKACQEERAQCIVALQDLNKAKHDYEHWKQCVKDYQEKVLDLLNPFLKMMDNLIYFAGCRSQVEYEGYQSVLHNAQEDIRIGLLPDMWGEKINLESLRSISVDMLRPPAQPSFSNNFPEVKAIDCKENSAEKIRDYQRVAQEAKALTKKYQMLSGTYLGRIKEDERTLDYILLLREFLGVITKIQSGFPETDQAEWVLSISKELNSIVENYRCVTEGMRFVWVYPYSEIYMESQSVRLEFSTAGTNCPGLFYYLSSDDGKDKLVRVIRGYRK